MVFGDPETLIKDPNWQYLLKFCELNKSFKHINGMPFKFPQPIEEAPHPILEPIENEEQTHQ